MPPLGRVRRSKRTQWRKWTNKLLSNDLSPTRLMSLPLANFYEKASFVKGRRGGSVIVAERNSLGPSRYASIRTSEEPHAFLWLGAFDEIRLLGLLKALQSSERSLCSCGMDQVRNGAVTSC
jgi:hypothetical protein